jgi:transmembrane sensor
MISEEQIERFFKKQCTPEEARQVADWLMSHPELVSKYLDEAEWQLSADAGSLPGEAYHKVWYQINRKIRKKNTILLLKRFAVAACVAGCIIATLIYLNKSTSASPAVASAKAPVSPVALADTEYNNTNKSCRILLEDGSVIWLLPKAVVWFETPFAKKQRNIHLRGEARFEVAKNKQKPFTVYAGAFATTALGTEFIVKQQNNNIKVQLLHGRVVIKAADTTIKNWKDVYLLPGQQMIFNENDKQPAIDLIQDKKNNTAIHAVQNNKLSETADSLIFNGSPISAVLRKLSNYYHVNVLFNESELRDISFTGVIAKKDAVQNILKVITRMNGLSLEEEDSSFIISKLKTNDTHL